MKLFRKQSSTNSEGVHVGQHEPTLASEPRHIAAATERISRLIQELLPNVAGLRLDDLTAGEQNALIAIKFPFRFVLGIIETAAAPREAKLRIEGLEVSAFIDGEAVYLGVLSGEGVEAGFESVVSFAAWVNAVLHVSGNVLGDLVTLRPRLAEHVADATRSQLAGALRQSASIILRRLSELDDRPPTHWFRVVNRALSVESTEADELEFCALWRQWRRDSGADGDHYGFAKEPLFAAGLIENALTGHERFHLKPEVLPVQTLRDWFAGGGAEVANIDLNVEFILEWSNQLLAAWASVPAVAFSYAISSE